MTDLTTRVEAIERHLGMVKPLPRNEPEREGPLGWKLATRILQSELYKTLDDAERAECDALVDGNPYLVSTSPSKPTRPERSQEYKDAMVAAQKAGIPVQFKSDAETKWTDSGNWCFDAWHNGDYRIKPNDEQPAKPAQRVARECEIKMHNDGILRARYKDGGVEFTEWTHVREVLPDE